MFKVQCNPLRELIQEVKVRPSIHWYAGSLASMCIGTSLSVLLQSDFLLFCQAMVGYVRECILSQIVSIDNIIGVFGVMNVKQYSLTISTGECCVTIINELTISHSDYYMG